MWGLSGWLGEIYVFYGAFISAGDRGGAMRGGGGRSTTKLEVGRVKH